MTEGPVDAVYAVVYYSVDKNWPYGLNICQIVFRHPSIDRCRDHLDLIAKGYSCSNPPQDPNHHFNYYLSFDRTRLWYQTGLWAEGHEERGVYPKKEGFYQIEKMTFGQHNTSDPKKPAPSVLVPIPVRFNDLPQANAKKKRVTARRMCQCGCPLK